MFSFTSTDWHKFLGITCVSVSLCFVSSVKAQITPDSTLPTNSNVNIQGNITNIEAGTTSGSNLFHSFKEFSIPTGNEAYFNNSVDISNIITRVTGGSISNIDGLIRANGRANLFLINPAGIIFGENAQLDIGGSFVGSTADAIGFDENNFFSASNPQNNSSLLQINPNALFFNQLNSQASIQSNSTADVGLENISGSGIDPSFFTSSGLRVADGKSLLLVGGNVTINGGGLTALGGRVELGGLSGTGRVGLNVDGDNLSLSFPSGVERSDVAIGNSAGVRVIADDGGSIAINARNFEITDESFLFAGIENGLGTEQSKAGNIDINATGGIKLNNTSFINNYVLPEAKGDGGDINISSKTLQVQGGAEISTRTFATGDGGKLTVQAESILLSASSEGGFVPKNLFTGAQRYSSGNGGDLTVKTNDLTLIDADIEVNASGGGDGGNLTIEAEDITLVGNSRIISPVESFSYSSVATGDGGDITIKTNSLGLFDEANIGTSTNGDASKGGNLTIEAKDIRLFGKSQLGTSARWKHGPNPKAALNAGDLTIKTNNLLLRGGAKVDTTIMTNAEGGNITIEAQDIQLIDSSNFSIISTIAAAENAGSVNIKTNTLLLQNDSKIATNRNGAYGKDRNSNFVPRAGDINIEAQDIQLIDSRLNSSSTSIVDAGDLNIKTNTLLLKDGAEINTIAILGKPGNLTINAEDIQLIGLGTRFWSTKRGPIQAGNVQKGGDIEITTNTLLIKDGAQIDSQGIFADGGNISIKTNTLLLQDGGQVSANTLNIGKGGNIKVEAEDIQLIGESKDGSPSGLFIISDPDSTGDAGDSLDIKTNTLLVKDGARVSASTFGEGNGGKINVEAQDIELIGESKDSSPSGLFTTTDSIGNAGESLDIKTNTLVVEDGARVSASTSGAGNGGKINVEAQGIELIGESKNSSPSGLFITAEEGSTGNAGESLDITTNSLLVEDGARVSASTSGAGNGGKINVEAQGIELIGESKDSSPSGLFTTTDSIGNAGESLDIKTNTLVVRDGARVSASTSGAGNGGDIKVNAQDIQLLGFGERKDDSSSGLFIRAEEGSTGNAGESLDITTNTLLVEDGARVSASTSGAGNGGDINVEAQDIQLLGFGESKDGYPSGLFIAAEEGSTGNAGEILDIKTNSLLVKDGAEVSASTSGAGAGGDINVEARNIVKVEDGARISAEGLSSGRAGNLSINADSIRLNNKAQLNASTQSNDDSKIQATINITSKDLIMRGESKIVTNAEGDNVNGGNININTDILAALENSDISANSLNFLGGNIRIEAQGIFGTQFRLKETGESDITATGADDIDNSSGNVEIFTPNIDLNTGLITLATIPVETEVAQSCTAGGSIAQSRFEIIGRGGLPILPNDALSADAVQVDLVSIKPENNKPAPTNVSTKKKTSTPKKIVEATGWVRNKKGEIFFVADAANGKQVNNWDKNNHCRG